jgi:hypothetical protein
MGRNIDRLDNTNSSILIKKYTNDGDEMQIQTEFGIHRVKSILEKLIGYLDFL